jgi:membrane-associated phospholipid phosphatase
VQLFYLLNGWAGRNAFIDEALRFFYVAAVPMLATALAFALLLHPLASPQQLETRRRTALAAVLAATCCLLTMAAINGFVQHYLGADMLSPRPFVTHRVTLLVVEPNDNSYPCPELMLAAVCATALWAIWPRAGLIAGMGVLLLGFTRVFCGSNYPADVFVGALIGWAWSALWLGILRVSLPVQTRDGHRLTWKARHQTLWSSGTLATVLVCMVAGLAVSPRFGTRFKSLFAGSAATAAPLTDKHSGALGESPLSEGEGVSMSPEANPAAPSHTPNIASHYGRQPGAEKYLKSALGKQPITHRIVAVEVAQVRAGNSAYRAALVQFAIKPNEPEARKQVAQTATLLAKAAFHADETLQTLDIMGLAADASSRHRKIEGESTIADGWRAIFTASIQRRNLRIINGPQWVNAQGVDPGLWLRARSRLYFDPQLLPAATPKPVVTPTPTPIVTPTPVPTPVVTPRPVVTPKPKSKPIVVPKAKSKPVVTQAAPEIKKVSPSKPRITRPIKRRVQPQAPRIRPRVRRVEPAPRRQRATRRSYTRRRTYNRRTTRQTRRYRSYRRYSR